MEHVHISTNWQELFSFLDDMLPTATPEVYENRGKIKFWVGKYGPNKAVELSYMTLNEEDLELEWETWCYCDPENVGEVIAFYQQEKAEGHSGIGEIIIES